MDPLAATLLSAITVAAGKILGGLLDGALEAAGEDILSSARAKLHAWAGLDERRAKAAFDEALRAALAELRRKFAGNEHAARALSLLESPGPEARRFRELAVEEFLFRGEPDIGRVLDEYRRNLNFDAFLRHDQTPPWDEVRPLLAHLFQDLLPTAMAQQEALKPIVLDHAELKTLAQVQAIARNTSATNTALARIETLLRELIELPRIHATINAAPGATISNSPLSILLGENAGATPPPAPPNLESLLYSYRDFLVSTHGVLDFRGIPQVQNVVRLKLTAIYVPLEGLPNRPSHGEQAPIDLKSSAPISTLVRDTPFLVILGDPGAGKSTLVKVIMLALAEGRAGPDLGLGDEWLPIYFPVASFAELRRNTANHGRSTLAFLSQYYVTRDRPDYTPLFERALLAGRALVLFDGLDEVREERLEIMRSLEDFIRVWDKPGNRFLATSRIAGYDDAPLAPTLFTRATIAPFQDEQIADFATRWSRAFEQAGVEPGSVSEPVLEQRAAARATALKQMIFHSSHVKALASNPLLLTILALIQHQGTRLPDRRVDLYRLCVEALAETWNRARSLSGQELPSYLGDEKLGERFVVNVLGPVALRIHAENSGGLVERGDLERWLTETLMELENWSKGKADRRAVEFISLVDEKMGLLQARGPDRYGFLHQTFEEYLAARGLIDSDTLDDPDGEIHRRATDPTWREVIRLAVASATQREASRLVLHLLEAPTDAQSYGRPVVLAGECLLDVGASDTPRRVWSTVVRALLALVCDAEARVSIRVEGGHVLGRLNDPRLLNWRTGEAAGLGEYEHVASYWCPLEAGPFWFDREHSEHPDLKLVELPHTLRIARYPVTNAEFAAFLEGNGPQGYDPARPWWTEEGRRFLSAQGARGLIEKDLEGTPIVRPRLWSDIRYNSPAQPVVGISWYEAAAYCRWLTAEGHRLGWLPADEVIRLPTSLEWERAARHIDRRLYPWGDVPPTAEHANLRVTNLGQPVPIGCFRAGRAVCGAEDLIGNVMEWLSTTHEGRSSATAAPVEDPAHTTTLSLALTHYGTAEAQATCGARYWGNPHFRVDHRGFRIVRAPALPKAVCHE